jgi:hypothetical protein
MMVTVWPLERVYHLPTYTQTNLPEGRRLIIHRFEDIKSHLQGFLTEKQVKLLLKIDG